MNYCLPLFLLSLASGFYASAVAQQIPPDTFKVFFLGGQSNMDGFGWNHELPENLSRSFDSVWIFHGNPAKDGADEGGIGHWARLAPGHGVSFKADTAKNHLSDRFGVELSFSDELQSIYPNEKIAMIKYSKGGSAIDKHARYIKGSWDPDFKLRKGINQYDHFLRCIELAKQQKDIDGDGRADYWQPAGIIWMQGESDAVFPHSARNYYDNLNSLMPLIRQAFGQDDLPVVIGKISDSRKNKRIKVWFFGNQVQKAQEQFARDDPNTEIVRSTGSYAYSDLFHYDSAGYIDLGEQFAKTLHHLIESRNVKSGGTD